MSMDPTYNPYTPVSIPKPSEQGGKMPLKGFVKVVCIFFVVLGSLGLLQTLQVIVGMLFLLAMDKNQFNPMTLFPGAMAIAIFIGFVNFGVSSCELAGGVMGLMQKRLGADLIRYVAGFMMVFKVIETAYGCVVNYLSIGPVVEQMTKQMPPQPANAPDVSFIMEIAMYVGIGFAILFGLVMFVFYLFSFLTFSKKETQSQFS